MKHFLVASCIALAASITVPAQASLIDHGNYITDSTSGYDWLDVALTAGISSQTAVASYASSGYRLATNVEVANLFVNAGAPASCYTNVFAQNHLANETNNCTFTAASWAASGLDDLYTYMRGSSTFGGNTWVHGYNADMDNDGLLSLSRIHGNNNFFRADVFTNGDNWSLAGSNSQIGSWLVRDGGGTVPEPASLALLGLGLAGIGFARRKQAA